MGSQLRFGSSRSATAASGPRAESRRATRRAPRRATSRGGGGVGGGDGDAGRRPHGGRSNSHAGGGVEVGVEARVQAPRWVGLLERSHESDEGLGS